MNRGAHLSHAARLAGDAQRCHIAVLLHLEAAGVDAVDADIADMIAADGAVTDWLQALADAYGHAEVERRAAATSCCEVAA